MEEEYDRLAFQAFINVMSLYSIDLNIIRFKGIILRKDLRWFLINTIS